MRYFIARLLLCSSSLITPFSMSFPPLVRFRATTQMAGTVNSKIIIVTPLARRRFAIAIAERTKQARNRQTETNTDCGETISKPTPIIKERNDHPMGFQAFGGSIGRAVGNTPLRNGRTWRSLMLRPRFALICFARPKSAEVDVDLGMGCSHSKFARYQSGGCIVRASFWQMS